MGYIGNKMSERAYEAYESGEKPLSKWTKTAIINTVLDYRDDFGYDELKKYSKDALKVFLIYSSWHHTGSYFNETSFYSLDESFIENEKNHIINVLEEKTQELKKEKEEKRLKKCDKKLEKCYFMYTEFEGTRKHPKAVEREAYGIIKGNWIYMESGKKSLNGKYIYKVKKFDRAPRGTAAIFKNIEKKIKK